jgi:hypothetical protein
VLRQTTLPSVPTRHQTFQRQLSHRLELPNIQFSVCSLEHRADSSIGLIKVRNNSWYVITVSLTFLPREPNWNLGYRLRWNIYPHFCQVLQFIYDILFLSQATTIYSLVFNIYNFPYLPLFCSGTLKKRIWGQINTIPITKTCFIKTHLNNTLSTSGHNSSYGVRCVTLRHPARRRRWGLNQACILCIKKMQRKKE